MEALRERLSFEDVTELFERPGSRDEFCRRFATLMIERLPIARCAVRLGTRNAFETVAAGGAAEPGDAVAPDDEALDALYRGEASLRGTTLLLPLATASGCGGFVAIREARERFDAEDVRRLRSYAQVLALAVEVAELSAEVERLADRSTSDALTGILNRRGFEERMRTEWRRAIREKSPIAVALLDIDYFKGYNDLWGRQRGDDCLKHVARAIQQAGLRAGDFVARYSGEEFAIVMPGAEEGGALSLCDRIRTFVALRAIEHPASPHRIVTVSAGLSATTPEPGSSLSHLLYAADTNLYRAKSAGRNRVAGDRAMRSSPLRAARLALPPVMHPFVGRERELAELAKLTAPLITIVGAAGIGKSALALEHARRCKTHAIYVDLTACGTDDEVGACVAQALTADPSGESALLLLLDGCDRVREGATAFATETIGTPGMRILATCREPLGTDGEQLYAPGPLSPEDALAFWEQCALEAGVHPEREPSKARERVQALRGVPRAIELELLTERYRTLSSAEQRVLGRLAVFARGCSWQAARAVCGEGSGQVLDDLADEAMLVIEPGDPPNVRVPEALHDFLRERLHDSGDRRSALQDFARYFASAPASVHRQNVEAVLDWAMSEGDLAAGAELLARQGMAYVRGLPDEARQRRMLEFGMSAGEGGAVPMPLRLRVTAMAAHMAFILGQFPTFERLSAWLESHSDSHDAYVAYVLTKRALERGELDRAEEAVRNGLAVANAGEDVQLQSALRVLQANIAWRQGDDDEAARLFGKIVRSLRAGDFHYGFESVMLRSTKFELSRNNVDEALARLLDVVRALRRRSKPGATAGAIDAYVEAACRRDKREIALRLHAFTEAYHHAQHRRRSPSAQAAYDEIVQRYGLPPVPSPPDISTVAEAFDVALTI